MSTDSNPYAPPPSIEEKKGRLAPKTYIQRPSGWLLGLCLLHCVIILGALVGEFFQIETILGSGPVFAISGLILLIVASSRRDIPMAVFAGTAPLFAAFVFVLINIKGWGPSEANKPVQAISFAYTLIALPAAIWLLVNRRTNKAEKSSEIL